MTGPAGSYQIGGRLASRSRSTAFAVVILVYLLAGAAAAAVVVALSGRHPLTVTVWADIAATVVVFAGSMAVTNASVYDPYWSVAPPVIVVAWFWSAGGWPPTARQVVVLAVVVVWAVRLTANWVGGWAGLSHEDWRYRQLRDDTAGRVPWWLVNLGGIQLMPTLVVLLALLPAWPALTVTDRKPGPLDALAVLVAAAAIALEATADRQRRRFAADPGNRGKILRHGVWRYSRHPNYLGEIGFWCSLWLFGLAAAPDWWWTIAGPLAMVALFTLVSVPLMDRRSLARRPGYADHIRAVPALLPGAHRRH